MFLHSAISLPFRSLPLPLSPPPPPSPPPLSLSLPLPPLLLPSFTTSCRVCQPRTALITKNNNNNNNNKTRRLAFVVADDDDYQPAADCGEAIGPLNLRLGILGLGLILTLSSLSRPTHAR